MMNMNDSDSIIDQLINEVRDDKTHGASQLAREALDIMRTAAISTQAEDAGQLRAELEEIGGRLMRVRPAMAPVYNTVNLLLEAISRHPAADISSLQQAVDNEVDRLVEDSVTALRKIAAYAANLVEDDETVMTHSYSSTVAAALKAARKKHRIEVIVTRSGPGRTGERTVWELSYSGIPVTFIDDTAMGLYVNEVDKVIVGADRICADGGLVNGAGTLLLALAAQKAGKPFYVLCETMKLDKRLQSSEVELEEKEPAEVAQPETLPEDTTVRNPYFDITPPELITGVITENGLVLPQDL